MLQLEMKTTRSDNVPPVYFAEGVFPYCGYDEENSIGMSPCEAIGGFCRRYGSIKCS